MEYIEIATEQDRLLISFQMHNGRDPGHAEALARELHDAISRVTTQTQIRIDFSGISWTSTVLNWELNAFYRACKAAGLGLDWYGIPDEVRPVFIFCHPNIEFLTPTSK